MRPEGAHPTAPHQVNKPGGGPWVWVRAQAGPMGRWAEGWEDREEVWARGSAGSGAIMIATRGDDSPRLPPRASYPLSQAQRLTEHSVAQRGPSSCSRCFLPPRTRMPASPWLPRCGSPPLSFLLSLPRKAGGGGARGGENTTVLPTDPQLPGTSCCKASLRSWFWGLGFD